MILTGDGEVFDLAVVADDGDLVAERLDARRGEEDLERLLLASLYLEDGRANLEHGQGDATRRHHTLQHNYTGFTRV